MSLDVTRFVPQPLAACFARCLSTIDALFQAGRERIAALPGRGGDVVRTATTYDRLVRVISLVMLLEARLKALVERASGGASASAVAPTQTAPAAPACALPDDRTDEEVEPKIERERDERPERPESLERERFAFERRGADDRSLSALVADICRELDFDVEATRQAQAPFIALEALLQGEPPPKLMDRARPRAPLPSTAEPPDGKSARVDARGPDKPP